MITGIVYFREIILESSQNVNETTPRTTRIDEISHVVLYSGCFVFWLIFGLSISIWIENMKFHQMYGDLQNGSAD